MMKKLLFLCTILFVSVVFLCSTTPAQATAFTFGDDAIYWPGWDNGTVEDSIDVLGVPSITGGSGTIDNGILTEVIFDYASNDSRLRAGDLFIDLGADATWDYIVQAKTGSQYALGNPVALGSDSYILSEQAWGAQGGNIRNEHPAYYDFNENDNPVLINEDAALTDFTDLTGHVVFANLDLDLMQAQDFIIGFTTNCANDVVYERVSVPEPGPMLLFGAFMIGMATVGRKKILNSKKKN